MGSCQWTRPAGIDDAKWREAEVACQAAQMTVDLVADKLRGIIGSDNPASVLYNKLTAFGAVKYPTVLQDDAIKDLSIDTRGVHDNAAITSPGYAAYDAMVACFEGRFFGVDTTQAFNLKVLLLKYLENKCAHSEQKAACKGDIGRAIVEDKIPEHVAVGLIQYLLMTGRATSAIDQCVVQVKSCASNAPQVFGIKLKDAEDFIKQCVKPPDPKLSELNPSSNQSLAKVP